MHLKIKYLLITILFYNYCVCQNIVIETPIFESPEDVYNKIFEDDKIANPIHLNGKVKTVERKYRQHESIYGDIVRHTQFYKYSLNESKKIVKFETTDINDDRTVESLNLKNIFKTKKDTIIKQDITEYIFKKGLLTLEKKINSDEIDSIVYNYNRYNKLIEIKDYTSYGIFKIDENGNEDENNIVFDKFELNFFENATYKDSITLAEKNKYIIGYKIIEHYRTLYSYNDLKQLKTYEQVYKEYNRDYINEQGENPINWKLNESKSIDYNPSKWIYSYKYDKENRIVETIEIIIDNYGKNEQFEYENVKNTIVYDAKLRTKTIHNITIKKFGPTDEPKRRELNYDYFYDDQNNPIKILNYIVQNNEKILDKSTLLNISYF